MAVLHRRWIGACSIIWVSAVCTATVTPQAVEPSPGPTWRAFSVPPGFQDGQWAPLVVLWSEPEKATNALMHSMAASGFLVVRVSDSDPEAMARFLDAQRRQHRIAQGGMHAVIADQADAAIAAVLAQRHHFQSVTVFGNAADADLAGLRRLRARRVQALPGADPAALTKHLVGLRRERELQGAAAEVAHTLDSFHDAAAVGDEDRYFVILPDDSVFLGTDASERWTGTEFRAFAMPYFQRPSAWTYVPLLRHIDIEPDGRTAWFDEVLDNKGYGECRGTGVLVKREGRWVLRQYNLTVPVPNDLLGDVAKRIRAFTDAQPPR